MSFSTNVKNEIKNKCFTTKKHHSKINEYKQKDDLKEMLCAAFLQSGTMSNPEKFYHLEFKTDTLADAESIRDALKEFDIQAKITKRRERYAVYIKGSEAISDMLAVFGAYNSMLELENIMVLKEMRGNVQRRVNFETANISKTVSASMKQAENIRYVLKMGRLPDELRSVAKLRLDYPDATLNELSDKMPGIGRSGINHRLRKISDIARQLKESEGTKA